MPGKCESAKVRIDYVYIYKYRSMYVYVHVNIYTHRYACMHACICPSICTYAEIENMYTYANLYVYVTYPICPEHGLATPDCLRRLALPRGRAIGPKIRQNAPKSNPETHSIRESPKLCQESLGAIKWICYVSPIWAL